MGMSVANNQCLVIEIIIIYNTADRQYHTMRTRKREREREWCLKN